MTPTQVKVPTTPAEGYELALVRIEEVAALLNDKRVTAKFQQTVAMLRRTGCPESNGNGRVP